MLADGHEVVGIDNLLTGRKENFAGELHIEDICDRDVFYGIANQVKPDLILHCAASYSNPNFWHRDTDTNVSGCINAAIAALHHDAHLVYFQTALPPISSYAISKIAGEQYIGLSDVEATIFRLANMYGPRNLSGPIPTFYKRLVAGDPCTVMDTARDMVYVGDLVDAVMVAIERDARGKFDICSGTHRPISDLYDAVKEAVGSDAVAAPGKAGADDVKQMELSPKAAAMALGWQASTPFDEGIAAAVAWYRQHGVDAAYTHLALKEATR
jgi:UDP-glucose 4-epimerase